MRVGGQSPSAARLLPALSCALANLAASTQARSAFCVRRSQSWQIHARLARYFNTLLLIVRTNPDDDTLSHCCRGLVNCMVQDRQHCMSAVAVHVVECVAAGLSGRAAARRQALRCVYVLCQDLFVAGTGLDSHAALLMPHFDALDALRARASDPGASVAEHYWDITLHRASIVGTAHRSAADRARHRA